ncbi:endospore germination permease [Paenibacillus sp. N4]|uniref:endospore germination permease n=1 Tax=Paenibacillus vietnamensis TaxID=2590547 RepID=UPI001CD17E94|nr:endospore germination permease [Paenibacillus vietnamensis]MCA0755439.1 endospore germination permease [Paenibacillus vietnamensis]
MKVKPFGVLPAMFIMTLSVGLVNHVLVVPLLLTAAKRDAWLCVLLALAVLLPWSAIPLYGLLARLNKQRFDVWLQKRMPAIIAHVIIAIFLVLLLLSAYETLVVTASWTATTYLPNTPPMVVCFVFLGLCLFASNAGLRTIAYVSCILLPLVVVLGDFVMSANMPHKDYRFLLPMLENGMPPVMKGALYCLTATGELFSLLFIQHHIRGKIKRWHLLGLVLVLALLAIGPATGAIVEFGPAEAEKMRYPAFAQWRLVSIGNYIEHVDFFAVFQWLSGALIRMSLAIHIISEFGPFRKMRRSWITYVVLGTPLFAASYYGIYHTIPYQKVILWCFTYFGLFIAAFVILIWLLSFIRSKRDPSGARREGYGKEAEAG